MITNGLPPKQGLYNPAHEKDACGVGSIVHKNGERSHEVVINGLQILKNLQHRGATGEDPYAGDGAGILTQIPHLFFKKATVNSFSLPDEEEYAVGMTFLPRNESEAAICRKLVEEVILAEKEIFLGWRKVPCVNTCLSRNLLHLEPLIYQFFIQRTEADTDAFERKLYLIRRQIEKKIKASSIEQKNFFYITSLSSRVIVYKGMFNAWQLEDYFTDFQDPDFTSSLALVHQRYSTNTFPTWSLAQPFRYIAHNGEINTLEGNQNWAKSREKQLESNLFANDLERLFPTIQEGNSDSASFDNYFELLIQSGRNMEHAMMLMMPQAWENDDRLSPELRGFYEYGSSLMEPWDGPAAMMFTNGLQIGACLDRNGLRPVRFTETYDGYFIMASESGVLPIPEENIKRKGNLGSGKMILIDTTTGDIFDDQAIKKRVSEQAPFSQWVDEHRIRLKDIPAPAQAHQPTHDNLRLSQRVFGYTYEELHMLMKPMAEDSQEATYAMGTDTPLAVLSTRPKLLYNYFKQRFAQVTNPAIDSIREDLVMSLRITIGGAYNILEDNPINCKTLEIAQPIFSNDELEQLKQLKMSGFRSKVVDVCYPLYEQSLEDAVATLCKQVEECVDQGFRLIILSDRNYSRKRAPIPTLLAVSAVHHYLIRANKRGKTGIVVESGEVREVHHAALLLAYGAGGINPYLAFESLTDMEMTGQLEKGINESKAHKNYISALKKGLLKIMAKMGISTLVSYQGAQIFEAIGLNTDVIGKFFEGTSSVIEGIGMSELEQELKTRHENAYKVEKHYFDKLSTGGEYHWRQQGEYHAYNPETVHLLQQAAWKNDPAIYEKFAKLVNERDEELCFLRGLFDFDLEERTSIPLNEVEPAKEIVKRFVTGAMSIGSISREAHETMAIAMNRLGGKSNTGEGGEDEIRFKPDANGDLRRSAIKQVASGRFGVTSNYLINADELQIKVAQGAKPGEGGQLPGFKVDEYISKLRHTIPGVSLISPPPHHDIYSIEDLSQLIFDLKNANRWADISVKLVSSTGVGTVAAGVAKALADSITISGYDGGTGASPATSIKHAGMPWELGLAEAQQTLVLNKLRGQIRLQVDGQLKTGRDVVIGALLGAEEFGFATSVLIATGCIMMRKCHLNTCPVGIATQDKYLRSKYHGKPEYVQNYLLFVAEEVRQYMAQLGYRTFEDMIGQVQRLKTNKAISHYKAQGLDFTPLFYKAEPTDAIYRNVKKQVHATGEAIDHELIDEVKEALDGKISASIDKKIYNVYRTFGTMLGSEISLRHGAKGLPEDHITLNLTGTAGQSFGAFIPSGLTMNLRGDANDYVGKGLSGGKIIIAPPQRSKLEPHKNVIVGNTCLYGATSGKAFFSGIAGQRFAVRNSGAQVVVEGVGDHACEYMTGGIVVVLGHTGKNFAAGMSGGISYVFDQDKKFKKNCNLSMVAVEKVIDEQRQNELFELIKQHYEYTGSPKAKVILNNWSRRIEDFVMVIPFEYRKILVQLDRDKNNAGQSPIEQLYQSTVTTQQVEIERL
ncbi:glutamate synthase large subunit [Solitalea koreensis]|uniref:Glutamate synthase [NADPH] large chain n=1 Tax=Solitalea koreensis TaxID=543615 RepID=A0A521BFP7_9SPHI|nr:glutamate synthase large subunit [Solitalea koreensis]SMO45946.1 glutamate synthase (NADH) large subunit [Solitalea koreensis]